MARDSSTNRGHRFSDKQYAAFTNHFSLTPVDDDLTYNEEDEVE